MFAYCGNNPVSRADFDGNSWICLLIGVITTLKVISNTISEIQAPQAKKKYNKETVAVYQRGDDSAKKKQVNAEFYYPNSSVSNISIDKSLEITSKAEQNAVLDVIIASPYYDESVYGSKSFMRAQWVAHNMSYEIATSSALGFKLMQTLAGVDNPTASSSSLDLRSKNNLLKRQKIIYSVISWVY